MNADIRYQGFWQYLQNIHWCDRILISLFLPFLIYLISLFAYFIDNTILSLIKISKLKNMEEIVSEMYNTFCCSLNQNIFFLFFSQHEQLHLIKYLLTFDLPLADLLYSFSSLQKKNAQYYDFKHNFHKNN